MTELEKIAYARSFIDKLAKGINPLDGTRIPEGDIANNVRLSRCFSYVSEILGQVYENGGIGKIEKTIPFAVTAEQLRYFEYSQYGITASEITRRLSDVVKNPQMKSLSVQKLNQWLIEAGFLYEGTDLQGKPRKMPTEKGSQLGILTEKKMGRDGEYIAILFDTRAQHFIVDNIHGIIGNR